MYSITVPEFTINSLTFNKTLNRTWVIEGVLNSGSSNKKYAEFFLKNVFLKIRAKISAVNIPKKNNKNNIIPLRLIKPRKVLSPKIAPMSNIYTGYLAEQVIKGDTNIVIIRSFLSSIVLEPRIAGTAQAAEDKSGIKDFPESPNFPINLSITKDALAM